MIDKLTIDKWVLNLSILEIKINNFIIKSINRIINTKKSNNFLTDNKK